MDEVSDYREASALLNTKYNAPSEIVTLDSGV
jgi:hypothetical protein